MADLRKKASMSQVMDDIKPYITKHFMAQSTVLERDIAAICQILLPHHQRTVQISEGSIQGITKKCRSYLYEMRSRKSLSIQKASIVKGVVRPNGALGAIRGLSKLL